MLLEVSDLNTFYGMSHVLQGISLTVAQGEIVALLGRNGMGKSTTLKSIMGLVKPRSGSVIFQEKDITGYPPYKVARAGIGYVPEDRRIFPNLSVVDNLFLGIKGGKIADPSDPNVWTIERIFHHFLMLKERAQQKGRFLSGGEQQMLTIGRSLMGNPDLLLVDEPTEGLAPLLVKEVRDILEGKRVIVVDDSIVRGTTSRKIVKMLRRGGAKEVHLRISCPPIRYPCFYGIDTPTRRELIGATHQVEEILKYIGADSLGYASIEGMLKSMPLPAKEFCVACFDGKYPLEFPRETSEKKHFEKRRPSYYVSPG